MKLSSGLVSETKREERRARKLNPAKARKSQRNLRWHQNKDQNFNPDIIPSIRITIF